VFSFTTQPLYLLYTGGWVDPRVGVDDVEKKTILGPTDKLVFVYKTAQRDISDHFITLIAPQYALRRREFLSEVKFGFFF
jgi:hypothetical protein